MAEWKRECLSKFDKMCLQAIKYIANGTVADVRRCIKFVEPSSKIAGALKKLERLNLISSRYEYPGGSVSSDRAVCPNCGSEELNKVDVWEQKVGEE